MERPLLVPLQIAHTPHGLDLRGLGSKLSRVLVLALLQQVLVATVTRVLITHPPVAIKKMAARSTKQCYFPAV